MESRPIPGPPPAISPDPTRDPLLAFASETAEPAVRVVATAPGRGPARPQLWRWVVAVVATAALVGSIVAVSQLRAGATRTRAPELGSVSVDTRPGVVEILIDGEKRGQTPLSLSLKPGLHSMVLRGGPEGQRVVPLTV